jgi:2-hydroxy-3-keto-5-methylthiopentenyl-1-phosphate phosphatase
MCIPLDKRQAMDAYLKTVRLDPGFGRFVEECDRLDVELIVNSDGFDHAIREVLANHQLSELTYFSNALVFDFPQSHFLHFPNGNARCMAAQGTCKCEIVARVAAQQKGVIVIGNDRTDACVARNFADFVFARPKEDQHPDQNDLVQACRKRQRRKIPYSTFGTFDQITRRLEKLAEDFRQATAKKRLYPWMRLTS